MFRNEIDWQHFLLFNLKLETWNLERVERRLKPAATLAAGYNTGAMVGRSMLRPYISFLVLFSELLTLNSELRLLKAAKRSMLLNPWMFVDDVCAARPGSTAPIFRCFARQGTRLTIYIWRTNIGMT